MLFVQHPVSCVVLFIQYPVCHELCRVAYSRYSLLFVLVYYSFNRYCVMCQGVVFVQQKVYFSFIIYCVMCQGVVFVQPIAAGSWWFFLYIMVCHCVGYTTYSLLYMLQTCLLLRFWCKMYALKALFTLLRASCQILRFLAAVSDFRLPTINLCKKFICEAGDRVTHMKAAFWLAACNARPNQL